MEQRQPHAALDIASRSMKARKIELLLGLDQPGQKIRLLEIGCGSGGICSYFGLHPTRRFEVHSVDVKDSRVAVEGYEFQLITDTNLPFPDQYFDVVISNHVIEHVGDESDQLHHLLEVRRVLKSTGIGYLAVPNRWMLVEPHYQLAFLSWFPEKIRSLYLRLMRGVPFYDCRPLSMSCAEKILRQSGLQFQNICVDAVRTMIRIEGAKGVLQKIITLIPDRILGFMNRINPTLVYRLSLQKNT